MFCSLQKRGARAALLAACAAAAALVSAASAGAHAFLTRSEPAAGAVVRTAPTGVRLFFSEPVEPAAGITVVRGGGQSVAARKPYVPAGNHQEIVIPLERGLGAGPYAVRWSEIDQEDGHLISGAFVFAVRSGLPPLASAAPATGGTGPPAHAVISRWLLIAGILAAAGAVGYGLLVSRPVLSAEAPDFAGRQDRADSFVLAAALAVATLGAVLSVVLEPGATGTRFGVRMIVGACIAAAGVGAALGSLRVPQLRLPAAAIALLLLALPTATGHASAQGVPHAISIPADLAHLAAAAFWLGGVLELALIAPLVLRHADRERRRALRSALARRFTPYAAGAVVLLGVSGILRAVNELDSIDQLWTTGYGQALLVKTALLCGLLVLGWLNRNRFGQVEIGAELALLAGVIAAVAVLTNVQPGIARGPALVAATTPTSHTVVFAGQDDNLAVGLGISPHGNDAVGLRATVLGFEGPVSGLDIGFAVDGKHASSTPCGDGCYRATVPLRGAPRVVSARIAGRGRPAATLRFAAPEQWPAQPAADIVRRAEETIGSLRTLVVHSRLGSDSHHEVRTTYRMVAPDRLAYHNVGGGDSIIIGNRRWDRQPGGPWVSSQQIPSLSQPAPFWPSGTTDAHVLRTAKVGDRPVWVVSFLDPSTPSWFTAWIDRSTYRTLRLDMVATAHFMHDRDGPFDAPVAVEPPGS